MKVTFSLVAALLMLGGCVTLPEPSRPRMAEGPRLAPAPLRPYVAGDQFLWNSGYRETVSAVSGDVVEWVDGDGNRSTGTHNFVLPFVAWNWPEISATGRNDTPPDTLWPLAVGKTATFKATQTQRRKINNAEFVVRNDWNCSVDGTETVTVPLGTMDTYKVSCVRYVGGSLMDSVTWNYAPEPGVVVRRTLSGVPTEDLVAFGPPAEGLPRTTAATVTKLRSKILETTPSDKTVTQRSGGVALTVTPVRTWATEAKVWCREFRETLVADRRNAMALATACRTGANRWEVPKDAAR